MPERIKKKIGVVADDVTGSNDIGVMFAKAGLTTDVIGLKGYKSWVCRGDVTVIDTNSRFDSSEEAYRKVYEATKYLDAHGAAQFYNKTCSVFRGNIGPEFDAMLDALGEDFAIVVLGFPQNGRTTVDSMHYVHGKLLEDSEFSRDPMNPMKKSNLVTILQEQTKRKVGAIRWNVVEKGWEALKDAILEEKLRFNYIILDVRNCEDLKTIARAIKDFKVICGASAIAEEIGAYIEPAASAMLPRPGFHPDKGILILAASLMPQTLSQIAYAEASGVARLELESIKLFEAGELKAQVRRLSESAIGVIKSGKDLIIHASNLKEVVEATRKEGRRRGMTDVDVSRLVSGTLAEVGRNIIDHTGQHRLLVAGGDTSASFCSAYDIEGMRVYKEIEPGLPSCISLKEPYLFMVLKSGSFGKNDFFVKALEHLKNELVGN